MARNSRAENAERRHFRHEIQRECAVAIMLRDHWKEAALHPFADLVTQTPLLRGEEIVELVEIGRFEI